MPDADTTRIDATILEAITSTRSRNAYWTDDELARAVREALLAEGQIVQHTDWGGRTLLVFPLEGDS